MMERVRIDSSRMGTKGVDLIEELLERVHSVEPPPFARYVPDIEDITAYAETIGDVRDLVVLGHGGSITTFKGIYKAFSLGREEKTRVHIIDTVDPNFIQTVRSSLDSKNTHVVAISRSGNTLTVIEMLAAFRGLPTTAVTMTGGNVLRSLASVNGWEVVDVPGEIGGRFSGNTASALLPAAVLGLDIARISRGMEKAYEHARKSRDLLDLCGEYYLAERIGKRVLYISVYSKALAGFNDLVTQLVHETLGKERKGLTALCFEGPECQHHTNQRILDGPEDVMTLFVDVDRTEGEKMIWEGEEGGIELKDVELKQLGGYDLSTAMRAEMWGVMRSMEELEVPFSRITLPGEDEEDLGFYIGLWHYMAYYSALLRGVGPFDQPAVDRAKESALGYRLGR